MKKKKYYSERHNLRERERYNEYELSDLFVQTYHELHKQNFFEELFGYKDEWGVWQHGIVAYNIDTFVFKKIGTKGLFPIEDDRYYNEEDVFDLIELFYDYVSERKMPNREYDKKAGQKIYLDEMNSVLNNYDKGYELTKEGYIRELLDNGLENLVDSSQEITSDCTFEEIVNNAKKKFFHYNADELDKKSAILELGGVLENLKKSNTLELLTTDESDLFHVLNKFNLRHNNLNQRPDYDKDVFYPWIFFNLLSAVDAALKLIRKKEDEIPF
ncbi:hypothetical protein MOE45_08605 [Bacillus atrophaeus]|nr:hypothetical protein [Bacillus atrophaeus]